MKVEMYNLVRLIAGKLEIELEASSVREALQQMADRYGSEFEASVYSQERGLAQGISILLKGRNIEGLQGLDTPLAPEDSLSVMSGMY